VADRLAVSGHNIESMSEPVCVQWAIQNSGNRSYEYVCQAGGCVRHIFHPTEVFELLYRGLFKTQETAVTNTSAGLGDVSAIFHPIEVLELLEMSPVEKDRITR
jgi:hypothetical protein